MGRSGDPCRRYLAEWSSIPGASASRLTTRATPASPLQAWRLPKVFPAQKPVATFLVIPRLWLVLAIFAALWGVNPLQSNAQDDADYSPASGHAAVIAQGVVAMPSGDVVWRTVRARALAPEGAPFEERALGFVLATGGPLLLTDQATGRQIRLGTGEAALVDAATVQRRSSLTGQPVDYLSLDLSPVDAPAPLDGAVVLQPGEPFAAPSGLRDLDLLGDAMTTGETLSVPNTGASSVILVTAGAAEIGQSGAEPVILLAGEAASFSGEFEVGPAATGGVGSASFVIALIGPEVPPPALGVVEASPTVTEPQLEPSATAAAQETASQTGSIAVQVFACPPGMTADSLDAAACIPAEVDFDVTLAGAALEGPLTLADATLAGDAFTWENLPAGDYVIAEALLPTGYDSYVLDAPGATGSAATGFRVTLDPAGSPLPVRIYNFAGE